jgi:hypothetical protein
VLENESLRRIFGPKKKEITGGWRKSRNNSMRIEIFMAAYFSIVGYDTTVLYIIFFFNFRGIKYKNYACPKC